MKPLKIAMNLVIALLLVIFVINCQMNFSVIDEKRHRFLCLNNLRQLGLTLQMYAQDYQGRCPVDATLPTLLGSMRLLSNYVWTAKILMCPSDRRTRDLPLSTSFAQLTQREIGYSYVPNTLWMANRGDAILALDKISETAVGSKWPRTSNHRSVKFMHLHFESTGGNVLFSDAHVDIHTNLPSALKDKDGREIVLSP